MRNLLFNILIVLFIIVLCACNSGNSLSDTPKSIIASATIKIYPTIPDEGVFSVSIYVPAAARANEEIQMIASLKNISNVDYMLSHGGGFFYFIVKDPEGKVNDFAMTMPLIYTTLESHGVITEPYTYTFKEPGIYEIFAVAKFSFNKDNKEKKFEINTNTIKLEVN
jgi:hypothetical protein